MRSTIAFVLLSWGSLLAVSLVGAGCGDDKNADSKPPSSSGGSAGAAGGQGGKGGSAAGSGGSMAGSGGSAAGSGGSGGKGGSAGTGGSGGKGGSSGQGGSAGQGAQGGTAGAGGSGALSAACQGCISGHCTSEYTACTGNADCVSCAFDPSQPTCASNPQFVAAVACACQPAACGAGACKGECSQLGGAGQGGGTQAPMYAPCSSDEQCATKLTSCVSGVCRGVCGGSIATEYADCGLPPPEAKGVTTECVYQDALFPCSTPPCEVTADGASFCALACTASSTCPYGTACKDGYCR